MLRMLHRDSQRSTEKHKVISVNLCATLRVSLWLFLFCICTLSIFAQRKDISLNSGWSTALVNTNQWKQVKIPHNWDDYYGYRRLLHGNLHGDALYKKTFIAPAFTKGKRVFLFFEGVGSYAAVYVNDQLVGAHAGGRTSFTLDITHAIHKSGSLNTVLVKVSHPSNIKDLPWVCGGCSDDRGFSEGSQPLGIFRPVHLIVTNEVRIEPFGVHAWADIKNKQANLFVNTTIKNYSSKKRNLTLTSQLINKEGKIIAEYIQSQSLNANDSLTLPVSSIMHPVSSIQLPVSGITLWSVQNPYLYKIISIVKENNIVIDRVQTDFGFRTINFKTASHQFLLNGKPVFINGIAEYEHLLGQSHAFSNTEIEARIKWVQSAGFNAFRDAHQPHNLLYGKLCNEKGLLWWTQFSAHVWYDTKEFRENFKTLLREWVIERRNDPAVILWGLQNESKLPKDFAAECTALIRSLDPTASAQRLVTTCNGGEGTDWDVPQNWTGTYGGDPVTYAADIKKQILIGEYGAWRTLDLHSEGGFKQNGILSEDRMVQLMEQKIRLAESVKDSCAGQFFWLLTSHDNPGRVQGGEGWRELDRVGPVNYKGLLTPWEEPTDAYYMFRSNYVSNKTSPMVYIASHTWPNRWMTPGIKDSINVYSNCDEVELFNDINNASLGKQKRNGIGTHFQWNKVNIQYNVLYAVGYVNGKAVAKDTVVLFHLPPPPHYKALYANAQSITSPQPGYNYIYRINCGGPEFVDNNGVVWQSDKRFVKSWADAFEGIPASFASQRRIFSPIKNTNDWKMFQTFRYGNNKLKYEMPLPDGVYMVDFYFTEPWVGTGGNAAAAGMRLFDVAVNGKTVIPDLDIWAAAGANTALKKTVKAKVSGGALTISFPQTKAGEAIISGFTIASVKKDIYAAYRKELKEIVCNGCGNMNWLDIGDNQFGDDTIKFNYLPPNLYGASWFRFFKHGLGVFNFTTAKAIDLFIGIENKRTIPGWLQGYEQTNTVVITDEGGGKKYHLYKKRIAGNTTWNEQIDHSFLVMYNEAGNMQPAFDLKPITQYKSNVVQLNDGAGKDSVNGRFCIVIQTEKPAVVEYPVQTGVADIYSLTVKYFYGKEQAVNARLQLVDAAGTILLNEPVNFTFTRSGKWNQFTLNTGTQINAGNYTIKLIVENAAGLAVSGIDVQ